MSWVNVDKYHLREGEWTISKMLSGETVAYQLWKNKELIEQFDTSEEAKKHKGIICGNL